jgi:hypothetical protein
MELHCIDNMHNGSEISLTIGNTYKVLEKVYYSVTVINDRGKRANYSLHRFADKSQYREFLLDKIFE